jgi:NAD(P)-dependent dehydrogenase (short-subunit alcohol dehydrogenase family)
MNEANANEVIGRLGADKVAFWNVNVADEDSVKAAVADVVTKFGAIHICNNYAGIGSAFKTFGKKGVFPLDQYMQVININLVGTFNVSRYAAEQMAKNEPVNKDGGRGVIINTASVAAYEGQVGQVAYSASKGGVIGMTLPMARDLASYGIRVNTIVPGLIHTPLFESLPEQAYKSLEASVCYPPRLGHPDEIAHLSVFIAENDYLNGESIRLDGAIRMQPR